jgi:hypothetical protein
MGSIVRLLFILSSLTCRTASKPNSSRTPLKEANGLIPTMQFYSEVATDSDQDIQADGFSEPDVSLFVCNICRDLNPTQYVWPIEPQELLESAHQGCHSCILLWTGIKFYYENRLSQYTTMFSLSRLLLRTQKGYVLEIELSCPSIEKSRPQPSVDIIEFHRLKGTLLTNQSPI